ncbi:MAG: hypothetical protein O7D30_04915 [Rickettsia endosymbiont of Ixodes persulcatus]|nr:hypothetical protein [Rickettsia endosymbiont of Ixodes persulcatus]
MQSYYKDNIIKLANCIYKDEEKEEHRQDPHKDEKRKKRKQKHKTEL